MDLTVIAYLLYFSITVPLTLWVGSALRRHGEIFLVDVFHGDSRLAHAVNQLLVIGFYLLNLGYVAVFMRSSTGVESSRQLVELLATKAGGVALVVGIVHFVNVWCLNAFRRRAVLRAHAIPPIEPNLYTPVATAQEGGWAAPDRPTPA